MQKFTGENAISSKEATAFLTIKGQNIDLFYAKALEAKITKNKQEIKALGSRMTGHKTTSASGEGTLTIYEVTSAFKEFFLDYVNKGIDYYFNIQVKNEDSSTPYGAETKLLTGANFDEMVIAQFDSDDGILEQELPFTFEGVELLSKYTSI